MTDNQPRASIPGPQDAGPVSNRAEEIKAFRAKFVAVNVRRDFWEKLKKLAIDERTSAAEQLNMAVKFWLDLSPGYEENDGSRFEEKD